MRHKVFLNEMSLISSEITLHLCIHHIAFVHSSHCTFVHAAQFKVTSRQDTTHKCMNTQYVYHIAHLCMEYVILNESVCVCIIDACSAIQSRVSRSHDTQVNRHTCNTIRVAYFDEETRAESWMRKCNVISDPIPSRTPRRHTSIYTSYMY